MKKILFIDRDGTLITEPKDYQVDHFNKLSFYPFVMTYLAKIVSEMDYELVMVTNQDGLGTTSFPENDFWPIQNFIVECFKNEGITFRDILIDSSFPEDNKMTRKPNTGMLTEYLNNSEYDLKNSFVIGDRLSDMELAGNIGAKGILLDGHWTKNQPNKTKLDPNIILKTSSWRAIYEKLCKKFREASISRTTHETKVLITINLDGKGKADIHTGISFFDHMLEQLARHAQIDLKIDVCGDLHVDEHHTIEDTAIGLGEAFQKALGNKIGLERYGFMLPMDECLAQVAIDLGGRSDFVWKAAFNREMIGGMATEMFSHFFKSFADAAKATIHIKAEGTNEHHKIESIFKAFARAIKSAIRRDSENMILPSTKGML